MILTSDFLIVEDAKIEYFDSQEGDKTIVLIHGLGLAYKNWEYQIEFFVKKGFRVIALNIRGHGNSKTSSYFWEFDTYLTDINSVITHLGINSFTLIGHSFGGMISQAYAHRYHENLKSLILVSTSSHVQATWGQYLEKLMNLLDIVRSPAMLLPAWLVGWPAYQMVRTDKFVLRTCFKHILEFNFTDKLDEIQIPTLIISSENDRTLQHEDSQLLADKLLYSKLLVFKKSGHQIMRKRKEKFNDALYSFITKYL